MDLFGAKWINLENDTIKILGVHFSYDKITIITKIECTLSLWRKHIVTLEGSILVFKTLALSKIIYISYLTDLFPTLINHLQSIQANSMWQGKKSKIKHISLISDNGDSGLKNNDIKAKMSSLPLAWNKRLFDTNFHPYKIIPIHIILSP